MLRVVRARDPERKADVISTETGEHTVEEHELLLEPFEVRDEPTAPTARADWQQAIPPPMPPPPGDE